MLAGIAAIAQATTSNPRLEILEANGCGISPIGARLLGAALSNGSSIRALKLRDNSIEDEGAGYLGAALNAGSQLNELDVGNNQVPLISGRLFSRKYCCAGQFGFSEVVTCD